MFLQPEGKLKGCWVMKIEDEPAARRPNPRTQAARRGDRRPSEEQKEKVIVRSDGTVTYVGKDMAYQLWKFGLLGKDFHYRIFEDSQPPALVHDIAAGRRRTESTVLRPRLVGLQRHRHHGSRTCRSC